MSPRKPQPMRFGPGSPLRGTVRVPGDKSISHRALICAAMAVGRSRIEGLNRGEDVARTAAALKAMGVRVEREGEACAVDGVGSGGLLQPAGPLDMGNSGTSARLLIGLVASHPISADFTGDESLRGRPMDRVIAPLSRIGAEIGSSPGGRLPLRVRGLCPAVPATHRMRLPSAQVKSALLFAALNIPGLTRVVEPAATRDHSERILKRFGADIEAAGGEIALRGESELEPQSVRIAGDSSAAAFLATAAAIVPGSDLRIDGVGVNPGRTGFFRLLEEMGAGLEFSGERDLDGEPVTDLRVRASPLRGIDVPASAAAAMIDEFPIFFVAAAFARGTSRARGLGELRIKESDRLKAMAEGLRAIGARVEESGDGLVVEGSGGAPLAGGAVRSRLDHRIALAFAVAGLGCRAPVIVDDMSPVETSFPDFAATLEAAR